MKARIMTVFAAAAVYSALTGGVFFYQYVKNSGLDRRRDAVLDLLRERSPMLINAALKSPSAVTMDEYDFLDNFSREPGLVELVYLSADGTVRWHRQAAAIGRKAEEVLSEASFSTGVTARASASLSFASGRAESGDLELAVPFSVKRRPVTMMAFSLSAAAHKAAAGAALIRYSAFAAGAVILLCVVLYFLLRRCVEGPLSSLSFWMESVSLRGGDPSREVAAPPAAGEVSQAAARLAGRARDEIAAVERRLSALRDSEQSWWRAILAASVPHGDHVVVVDENNNVVYANFDLGAGESGRKIHLLDVVDSQQQNLLRLIGRAFESPGVPVEGETLFKGRTSRVRVLHSGEGSELGRTLVLFSPVPSA